MCAPNLMSLRPVVVLKLFFSHSKLKTAISIGAKLEEKTTSAQMFMVLRRCIPGAFMIL